MSPSSPRSPRAAPMDLPPMPPSPPAQPTVVQPAGPPPLETNTLALLLPHPFLFSPPLQSLLREHYESYGKIRAWAPIRAFGRVIIVYETFAAAERAKREGDRLVLGDDDELEAGGATPETSEPVATDTGLDRRPSQQRKVPSKLILRLYCAAPTPLDPIVPASQHLEPPPLTRNFLISPPGSPPDGWEPIVEDPPNCATLAHDLMAALEKLSARAARGEKEVILPEAVAGVGVTVQDMTPDADDDGSAGGALGAGAFDPSAEIFESEEGRRRGSIGLVRATVDSFGGADAADDSPFGGAGDAFAPTPGAADLPSFALGGDVESVPRKAKIAPTPMPPLPLR